MCNDKYSQGFIQTHSFTFWGILHVSYLSIKIEQVLWGIPVVLCRVDNILILQGNDQKHLVHLNEVLARLESSDLRLKLSKCKFMQPTVEHLGYQIDGEENSPILVRKEISPIQGSQAIKHIAGTEKRYPNSRSRTITKMGLSACCTPI